nr:MAG TPA: ATP synthase subunit 9 [Caudoviricetes sp.]
MKVGDKRMMKPHEFQDDPRHPNRSKLLPCTVIYIHPQRRFYRVEFETRGGKFRESFYFPGRGGND